MKVSEIFKDEPDQWGLRGDPLLWRELERKFQNIDMPELPSELKELIEKEYEDTTGHKVTKLKNIGIKRFKSHGMSSGFVCPEFWLTIGIPLLVSRHV